MTLPTQARIVVIGGGAVGCSIAYHLGKLGQKDVLVLEKSGLTHGSTWHAAGLVGQLRSSVTLTRMMMYGTELYRRLAAETGTDPVRVLLRSFPTVVDGELYASDEPGIGIDLDWPAVIARATKRMTITP